MISQDISPVSNNRDDFTWEEHKEPPAKELRGFVNSLPAMINEYSAKIDQYIEEKSLDLAAEMFYSAKASVYGSAIFVRVDNFDIRFELKDLLDGAIQEIDNCEYPDDKRYTIEKLLPLLRSYVEQLEARQEH